MVYLSSDECLQLRCSCSTDEVQMDSPGKPLIVDRLEDQVQLYRTTDISISPYNQVSSFLYGFFGRWFGEEHECGISQKRPPDLLSMSSFAFLKTLPYMVTVKLFPHIVMNLLTHVD